MKSLDELKAIREKMQSQIGIRSEIEHASTRIVVGMATCGIAAGARPVLKALSDAIHSKGLEDVMVTQTGCVGLCQYEPIVEVIESGKEKVTYINMDAKKAEEIIEQHIIRGQIVNEYTINSKMGK
ncbi:MAG TPA: (2Fe-2S) ferredoxin domain-containing protein [Clostridiales bacterium]|nr:(2Fe-2S) ferredoxin domain-containing protein [Clostridiales bacterium]